MDQGMAQHLDQGMGHMGVSQGSCLASPSRPRSGSTFLQSMMRLILQVSRHAHMYTSSSV